MKFVDMIFSDCYQKEKLNQQVLNELRLRYDIITNKGKEKKSKVVPAKVSRRRIFHSQLVNLELIDVILVYGNVVQIPKFVADACNRIMEQIETEGLFRKAGSFLRQKEIRASLEAGLPLGKFHHVIDVANLLKNFFRELSDPLIPVAFQEAFLKSLASGENHEQAVLLCCLLLPPLNINTLAFLMQFLLSVSLSSNVNKMTIVNLAIIFSPGLMPCANLNSQRFQSHVKIIELLIKNANLIGVVPNYITSTFRQHESLELLSSRPGPSLCSIEEHKNNKKKKRRSDIFNGFKKIVTSALGSSSENLDIPSYPFVQVTNSKTSPLSSAAESINHKSTRTRKNCKLSDKIIQTKKGEPKCRLSLGQKLTKPDCIKNITTSVERRWSMVGPSWSKQKAKPEVYSPENLLINNGVLENSSHQNYGGNGKTYMPTNGDDNSGCSHISKSEYEAIKDRVIAIETRLSQEFDSLKRFSSTALVKDYFDDHNSNDFTVTPCTRTPLRLASNLNVPRILERPICRAPSARRIGTIRRRSYRRTSAIKCNSTWHINGNPLTNAEKNSPQYKEFICNKKKWNMKNDDFEDGILTTMKQPHHAPFEYKSSSPWTPGEFFFTYLDPRDANHDTIIAMTPDFPKTSQQVPNSNSTNLMQSHSISPHCANLSSTPVTADFQGRASILRLRLQNAGMVMAKAKLFNSLMDGSAIK